MSQNIERIIAAIGNTREILPSYFEKTLEQRLDNNSAAGSIFEGFGTIQEVEDKILTSQWEEYRHENLAPDTTGFCCHWIGGCIGTVPLTTLDDTQVVILDDRKNTGRVSATVKGVRGASTDLTVIILGQHEGREVIFTIHPGAPVKPSTVTMESGMHGKTITAKEAIELGLQTAKITS